MPDEWDDSLAVHLRLGSDRICNLIFHSDLQWIDIEIEAGKLRDLCEELAPTKTDLFDAIYTSRFERLWAQWRSHDDPPWGHCK
jgi:hypothetical protein